MRNFYLDTANKTVNLSFDFDKNIVAEIKSCDFNCRWNPEYEQWIVPINAYSKNRILGIIKDYGFKQVKEKIEKEVSVSYKQTEVDYAYLKGLCDAKGFTYTPRDYQLEALGYAREKGSLINGDDVGLGKTFEAIMYAETSNSFPCLVIVPASVKYNWQEKWLEITGNKRSVSVIESKETKKRKNDWGADVVIINYDIIGKKQGKGATVKFEELAKTPWKMAIADEAHFLKEKNSQRAKAAKMIFKPKDLIIQLLTGTAVMSKPVELWNLLKLVKMDDKIAVDWHQYIRRYCGGYRGKFGWVTDGATYLLELNQKLRDNCYIRREKRDVLSEMPDVTRQIIQMPINNLKEIGKAIDNFIEYMRESKGEEAAEKAMEAEHLVALGVLRKLAIAGKMKAIELYLKDWKAAGDKKLVVFGLHREGLDYLTEKFGGELIAGGVSAINKQKIVKDWQVSKNQFLFANMESAGTGIDGLQNVCSNMAIIELPWRPSDLSQVIGRLDRSGQTEAVTVSFLLSDETIDSDMWDMLLGKEAVTEAVNKGIDVKRQKSGMRAVIKSILKKAKEK